MCNEVILKNADKGYNDASEFRCLIEPEGVVVTRVFRSQYSTKILIAPRLSGFNGSGCQSKGVYNVTAIGEGAFAGCDYKEIRIIGGCYDKAGNLDNDGNMYGPQEIRSKAFADCKNLCWISLPDTLKKIKSLAFSGCSSLESITIPNSVTEISDDAFDGCPKLTIYGKQGSCAARHAIQHHIPFRE